MNEDDLRAELNAVYHSWSWRITAPLRFASAALRSLKPKNFSLKRMAASFVRLLLRQPALVAFIKNMLNRFPGLKERFKRVAQSSIRIDAKPYSLMPVVMPTSGDEAEVSKPLSEASCLILQALQTKRNKNLQ
jgi:hypothetical protein